MEGSDHPLVRLLHAEHRPASADALEQLAVCRDIGPRAAAATTSTSTGSSTGESGSHLNPSQRAAAAAVAVGPTPYLVTLVQGPPGTGKTSTVT